MGLTEEELEDVLRKRRQTAQAAPESTPSAPAKKRGKYGNKAVLVDLGPSGEVVGGKLRLVHTFDSQKEADHYQTLKLQRHAGELTHLKLQEPLALIVQRPDGQPQIVGYYEADFTYQDQTGPHVVDVKSSITKGLGVYRLKKAIIEACHGITIEEV